MTHAHKQLSPNTHAHKQGWMTLLWRNGVEEQHGSVGQWISNQFIQNQVFFLWIYEHFFLFSLVSSFFLPPLLHVRRFVFPVSLFQLGSLRLFPIMTIENYEDEDVDYTSRQTRSIHNTTQHNTTQHNTTQHNTTQHNLISVPFLVLSSSHSHTYHPPTQRFNVYSWSSLFCSWLVVSCCLGLPSLSLSPFLFPSLSLTEGSLSPSLLLILLPRFFLLA